MRTYKLVLIAFSLILNIAFIPENTAQSWQLIEKLGSSDLQPGDNLGVSVDISDSLLIAGAWSSEGSSGITNSGAVYIYKLQIDGKYREEVKLTSPNPESLGYFGFRVAISGRNALVGAFNEDHSGLGNAGRVYAYSNDPIEGWMIKDTLQLQNAEQADYFGYDIAMIDDYALIGAYRHPLDQNNGNSVEQAGAAFLYKREPSDKWTLVKKIVAQDRSEEDYFGRHVAMDDGGLIMSAFNKDASGSITEAGVAYAIKCEGSCNFDNLNIQDMKKIQDTDPNSKQQFGWDVSISGNWVAIGKRSNSSHPDGGFASNIGAVYFYKWEEREWVHKQKVYANDYGTNAHFGERIAMEGGICIVGAGGEAKDEAGENPLVMSGAAYAFELNSEEVWVLKQKLVGDKRSFSDLFANEGLAIDKKRFAAGAWLADSINSEFVVDGGAVYVYEREGNLHSNTLNIGLKNTIKLVNNPSRYGISLHSEFLFNGNLQVFTLSGSLVSSQKLIFENQTTINTSDIPAGIYIIKLINEEGERAFKWVKI